MVSFSIQGCALLISLLSGVRAQTSVNSTANFTAAQVLAFWDEHIPSLLIEHNVLGASVSVVTPNDGILSAAYGKSSIDRENTVRFSVIQKKAHRYRKSII